MTRSGHLEVELRAAADQWIASGRPTAQIMLVAGSGLAVQLGDTLAAPTPLAEVVPFATAAVSGHALSLEVVQTRSGGRVLYQRGRLHAYQGFGVAEVVFTVRLAHLLGVHTLIVTNAAGGIYQDARPGDLVLIRDHLNYTGLNPLVGRLPSTWGPQFPSMTDAYDPALLRRASKVGQELRISLRDGVYAGLLGPSYETPAEIEALRRLGADLVGMSTVLEVIAARHLGMRCLGLSLVTNAAAGTGPDALDHDDVLEVSGRAAGSVQRLLARLIDDPLLQKGSVRGGAAGRP